MTDADWTGTPLGSPTAWPSELRTAARFVLRSPEPACAWWGARRTCLWNAACAPFVGACPAGAPAEVAWAEAWSRLGPAAERALGGDGTVASWDGPRPLRFTCHGLLDDDGVPAGVLCFVREAGAPDAGSRDELLAMLAHELRGPLGALQHALELVAQARGSETATDHARRVMERQVRQLTRLVGDVLDLERARAGRLAFELGPVHVRSALDAALEVAGALLDERGHALEVRLADDPVVVADPGRLAQVLANLLTNAAKYTPDHGRVTVWTEPDGDRVAIHVTDTGRGIPPEQRTRVFDTFVRLGPADERADGLGIGLALVRRMVARQGGTVSVRGAGPGRGSDFVVRLPSAFPPGRS